MKISVVICTYNRCDLLRKVLIDIEKQVVSAELTWEVIIVDNNSTDRTRDVVDSFVKKAPERFKYIFEKQQGKSFALNAAIQAARGEILAFTDDDVLVAPHWLTELNNVLANNNCIGVGGRVVPIWPSKKPSWLQTEGPYRLLAAVVYFELGDEVCDLKTAPFGANTALKRSAFEKYGLFRTDLGPVAGMMGLGEDTEFCKRLLKAGEKLVYSPKAIVFHPVEKERMRKKYFQTWYFNYGKSLGRLEGIPSATVRYFGIPRYLIREFLACFLKWMGTFNRPLRFWHKLQLYQTLGAIAETTEVCKHSR